MLDFRGDIGGLIVDTLFDQGFSIVSGQDGISVNPWADSAKA
jgi:hypothetical protein